MGGEAVVDVFRQGLFVVITIVMVLVLPGLVVGLIVAMFQAATQINEMSLSFIPKLVVTLLTLGMAAPWMLKTMIQFTQTLITQIPSMVT